MDKNLKNLNIAELKRLVTELNQPAYQAGSIFQWVQQKGVTQLDQMTNLSRQFRQELTKKGFFISELETVRKDQDSDGTVKYLFGLSDGLKIETVVLNDEDRKTLCISSQVGCKMDCKFCATGAMKFKRNLLSAEIIDQVIQVEKDGQRLNNLVFMGMGEPLDNYDSVLKAIYILNDKQGKNIGARHITVSTAGLIPGIKKLSEEALQVRLAVSLHAHTDAIRGDLMPINKKYPIKELIQTVREYQKKTNRRVTFEYVLIEGINDSREHARGLLKLVNGIKCNINLIEYNSHARSCFKPSPKKTMKDFAWIIKDRGFEVNLRYKRGREINAACGQLGANAV